jgi:hypothetical protein
VFLFKYQSQGETIQVYPHQAKKVSTRKGIAAGGSHRYTRKIRRNVQENCPATQISERNLETLCSQAFRLGKKKKKQTPIA